MAHALFAALLAMIVVPAAAQNPPPVTNNETFKTVIGKWEISNADRDRTCALTFKSDPSGNLFKLELDKGCQAQMPEMKDAVGWTIAGLDIVRLVDAKGKALMEFTPVEAGMFEAQRPAALAADQMAGDWGVVRSSGKKICTITLTNTAAGQDAFALKLKPGCDAAVTRFGPAAWYMDHGELVLRSGRGQFWRFEESDPTNWQRVPEGADPITLVRQ
jgi:hypothetical protein